MSPARSRQIGLRGKFSGFFYFRKHIPLYLVRKLRDGDLTCCRGNTWVDNFTQRFSGAHARPLSWIRRSSKIRRRLIFFISLALA